MTNATHKIILVTGSTDGAGRQVAEILGRRGHMILVHGRDRRRAEAVARNIEAAGGRARVFLSDFSSLEDVRALAGTILRDHPRIDVLINNAGIGFGPPGGGRAESRDGHELRFAVNYLAPFLLTRFLLPGLPAGLGRIVNVASVGQEPIDLSDIMLRRGWSGERAYRRSKLALIMLSFDLAEELRGAGVTVNALHPATFMATTMVRESGIAPQSSVEEGAAAIVALAVSPRLEGKTGLYFDGERPVRAHDQAYDAGMRARLRDLSFALVGLAPSATSTPPGNGSTRT